MIELLTSMKGVSVFIAIAIIVDIIDVSRFKNSKHFMSYLRSAPMWTTRIPRSVSLLMQSLNHVMRTSLKLRRWYVRLSEYKKAGLVRTGLRRRVFAEIYQLLKKGEYHYGRDPQNHELKMAHYQRFLEQQKEKGEVQITLINTDT